MNINLQDKNIDANISINKEGVSLNVKKFDVNNFNIDKVFKYFDKISSKAKSFKKNKENKSIPEKTDESCNDEYVIVIE